MVDILLIVFLIFMVVKGYRRGLLLTILNLTGNIIALVVAYLYHQELKIFLMSTTKLDARIYELISKKLVNFSVNPDGAMTNVEAFKSFPLPESLKSSITSSFTQGAENIGMGIAKLLADMSLTIISAIIIYFVVLLSIGILSHALNLVSKLPIIKGFNSLGGAIGGLFIGGIGLSVIISILLFFAPFTEVEAIDKSVSSSKIIDLYTKNGFVFIFK